MYCGNASVFRTLSYKMRHDTRSINIVKMSTMTHSNLGEIKHQPKPSQTLIWQVFKLVVALNSQSLHISIEVLILLIKFVHIRRLFFSKIKIK